MTGVRDIGRGRRPLREPLPRLLFIGDGFTDAAVSKKIVEAVKSGVHWVQLRDHDAGAEAFAARAGELTARLRAISPDVLISVNTRVGVAEALDCALHVGTRGPAPSDAAGLIRDGLPIGLSVHDEADLDADAADYFLWSPVFETVNKPDARPTGLDRLAGACRRADPMPVIALGGITPERASECLANGAYGVAVLSGILRAEDIGGAVLSYRKAMKQGGD